MSTIRAFIQVAFVLLLVVLPLAPGAAGEPSFPVIGGPAPDFVLTDQMGRTVRMGELRGRLVLLNFIYTRCPDVCPLTTAALARVQRDLIRYGIEVRAGARALQTHALPAFVTDRRGFVLGAYGVRPDPKDVISDVTKLR